MIAIEPASPSLDLVDDSVADTIVCPLFDDEQPPRGIAGLVDWRLGGGLSSLMMAGVLTGARGEQSLLPGRPRLRCDRVIVMGVGARKTFDGAALDAWSARLAIVLRDLRARRALVELPGRRDESIAAEIAARALDAAVHDVLPIDADDPALVAITIVDTPASHAAYVECSRVRARNQRRS